MYYAISRMNVELISKHFINIYKDRGMNSDNNVYNKMSHILKFFCLSFADNQLYGRIGIEPKQNAKIK